jgi:hypothetical protein
MLTEFELRQLKHYRAMANELINPLVPENSVEYQIRTKFRRLPWQAHYKL